MLTTIAPSYQTRFVPAAMVPELLNLWHTSRMAHHGRYDRLIWTVKTFVHGHPELAFSAVYKDLDCLTQ